MTSPCPSICVSASCLPSGRRVCRQAGERFGVSAASVSRWHARHLRDGHVRPKPNGRRPALAGHRGSCPADPEAVRGAWQHRAAELRPRFWPRGRHHQHKRPVALPGRHRITRKKGLSTPPSRTAGRSAGAPGVFEGQLDLDRTVWCSLMRRQPRPGWHAAYGGPHAASAVACRCHAGTTKTTTVTAPCARAPDGNGDLRGRYQRPALPGLRHRPLVPVLRPGRYGDPRQPPGPTRWWACARPLRRRARGWGTCRPTARSSTRSSRPSPSSRRCCAHAAARTVEDLHAAIAKPSAAFTPQECRNYLNAAGYQTDC